MLRAAEERETNAGPLLLLLMRLELAKADAAELGRVRETDEVGTKAWALGKARAVAAKARALNFIVALRKFRLVGFIELADFGWKLELRLMRSGRGEGRKQKPERMKQLAEEEEVPFECRTRTARRSGRWTDDFQVSGYIIN